MRNDISMQPLHNSRQMSQIRVIRKSQMSMCKWVFLYISFDMKYILKLGWAYIITIIPGYVDI